MDENTIAGVVPSSGWVSTDGTGAGANGTLDNNGVTIDWSSNGTWNTNNGVTNGDNHLMNGYIDAVNAGGYSDINISGIDTFAFGAEYNLYVYFGSDADANVNIMHIYAAVANNLVSAKVQEITDTYLMFDTD